MSGSGMDRLALRPEMRGKGKGGTEEDARVSGFP